MTLHTAFVELDRATMALEALVAKLGRYVRLHDYAGSPGRVRVGAGALWREHYRRFPAVLVVLANASHRRLWNRRWLVQFGWVRDHAEHARSIELRVCIFEDLIEQGPFAPIFMNTERELVDWLGNPPEARAARRAGRAGDGRRAAGRRAGARARAARRGGVGAVHGRSADAGP